jgi:membrane protein
VIVLAMVLLIFGQAIGEYMLKFMNYPQGFELIWVILKYAIPLLAMIGVFTFLYWMTPNRKLSFREVIPGAIFTTAGWIVTSLLFQFYINNFGNYTKTYGSLGGVIALLIWLYISSNIIILGGEINATLAHGRDGVERELGKQYGSPLPWFKRLMASAKQGQKDATSEKHAVTGRSRDGGKARKNDKSLGQSTYS